MDRLARFIVWFSAWLVPRAARPRWREEWLAELDAARSGQNLERRTENSELLRKTLGAPLDAWALRIEAIGTSLRALRSGAASDLRQTSRALLRSPRHVAAVVLCLGVGITVSVSVFSFINSLLYGEVPGIRERRTLVRLFVSHAHTNSQESIGRQGPVSAAPLSLTDFDVLTAPPDATFTGWAAEGDMRFAVSFDGRPAVVTGVFVSPQYFDVLGTVPAQGRLLSAADHRPGAAPAAVLGFHVWRDRFGSADVVGRPLLVGTRTYTIVGIAPARFTGMQPTDFAADTLEGTQLWLPMRDARTWPGAVRAMDPWLSVRGRLAPGLTQPDAKPALDAAAARLLAAYPTDRQRASFVVSSYGFGPGDSPLDVLIIVALFLAVPLSVLAIGCANVANLQLARATERARELAVRLAIGASRGQIVRLLCLEGLLLAALATAAGWTGSALIVGAMQDLFPLTIDFALDRHVLLFTVTLTAGVTLLSGLAPAWIVTRRSTAAGLQQSSRAGGLAHARLRNALVVVQIAASLVLLIMAGLFTQSVRAMQADTPPAYREQVIASFDLDLISYTPAERSRFFETLMGRVSADPRARGAAAEQFTGFRYRRLGGDAGAEHRSADGGFVTAGWTDATSRRIVAGRAIRPDDGSDVALVSARLSQSVHIGDSVEISTGTNAPFRIVRIVGVVEDLRRRPDVGMPDEAMYVPMPAQIPAWFTVRVRTSDPAAMTEDLRQIVRGIDPRLPWEHVEPAETAYLRDTGPLRYTAMSVGGFGVVAMLLAAAGLFAVTAYVVSLRTREIGIRVAIGANRRDVVALVVRQSLRLAIIGAVVGAGVAVPLAFAMQATFVGASPIDAASFVLPILLLLGVALAASVLPARRAAAIDPVVALRAE